MGMEPAVFLYCTSVSVTRNKLYGGTMDSGYNYRVRKKCSDLYYDAWRMFGED